MTQKGATTQAQALNHKGSTHKASNPREFHSEPVNTVHHGSLSTEASSTHALAATLLFREGFCKGGQVSFQQMVLFTYISAARSRLYLYLLQGFRLWLRDCTGGVVVHYNQHWPFACWINDNWQPLQCFHFVSTYCCVSPWWNTCQIPAAQDHPDHISIGVIEQPGQNFVKWQATCGGSRTWRPRPAFPSKHTSKRIPDFWRSITSRFTK